MFILALFKISEKLEMSKCPKLKKCSIKSGTSILLKNVCVSVCVHVHSVTKLCPTL